MISFTQHSILHIPFLLFLFGFITSCGGTQQKDIPKEQTQTNVIFDTIQKAHIDSIVNIINGGLSAVGPQKLPYPLHNPKDTIYCWKLNDDAARISIEWTLPNQIIWPTFFVYQGDLIFVRYRYMLNEPPTNSRAFESMIYLNHGEIVYCEERGQPLQEGEKPAALRVKEYSRSTRSVAEIEKDYMEYWKTVKAFMKQNDALPSFIK